MGKVSKKDSREVYAKEETKKIGKEVAIIFGGGTSAQDIFDEAGLVEAMQAHTVFGCNKVVESVKCDVMVYHDHPFATSHHSLVENFEGAGGVYAPRPSKKVKLKMRLRNDVTYFKTTDKFMFSMDDGIYTGNNCGLAAMNLAIALGYKEIWLIGMDCKFDLKKTKTHFHDGYNKPVSGENVYDGFAHYFEQTGKYLKENRPDIKIYNCSQISNMDPEQAYFERMDIRYLLYDDSRRDK